tara:strand:- start:447 stop:677 length:231 start_codon:yes stop_codon:yes gene_type:complete
MKKSILKLLIFFFISLQASIAIAFEDGYGVNDDVQVCPFDDSEDTDNNGVLDNTDTDGVNGAFWGDAMPFHPLVNN